MRVVTSRFAELDVQEENLLSFPEGLLGFEDLHKFFIVDREDNTLIMWLQSAEKPELAVPILEPRAFHPTYTDQVLANEVAALNLNGREVLVLYSILTIPEDVTQMTANLKAPLIIDRVTRVGRQVVLQDNQLPVRHEMYKELKGHLISMANRISGTSATRKGQTPPSLRPGREV